MSFLGESAIYMVNQTLVYHMRYTLEQSSAVIGLAAALYTSVCFISCLTLSGKVTVFSNWKLVSFSMLLIACSAAGIAFSASVAPVFVFLIFHGLGISLFWGPLEGWIADGIGGKKLNRSLGAFNICWCLGIGAAPYITSFLIQKSMRTSFLFGAFLAALIVIGAPVLSALERRLKWHAVSDEPEETIPAAERDDTGRLRVVSFLSGSTAYTILSVLQNIFPLYAVEQLSLNERQAGELLLGRGVISCLFFIVYSRTSRWQFRPALIKTVILILALACLLPAVFPGLAPILLFFFVFGMLYSLCYDFSIFHAQAGDSGKSKMMMRHEGFANFGSVAGAAAGGLLYDHMGFKALLAFVAVFAVLLLVAFELGTRRKKVPATQKR